MESFERRLKNIKRDHLRLSNNQVEIYYFQIPFSKKSLPFSFTTNVMPDLGTITVLNTTKCNKWYCDLKIRVNNRELIITKKQPDIVAVGIYAYKFQLLGRFYKEGLFSGDLIVAILKTINFPTGIVDIDRQILLQMDDYQIETYSENKYLAYIIEQNNFWRLRLAQEMSKKYGSEVKLPEYNIRVLNYRLLYEKPDFLEVAKFKIGNRSLLSDMIDRGGVLPLDKMMLKAVKKVVYLVEAFVKNGASVTTENSKAVLIAVKEGRLSILRYLDQQGADLHTDHYKALIIASYRDYPDIARYLLNRGADIHTFNDIILIEVIKGTLVSNWGGFIDPQSHDSDSYNEMVRNEERKAGDRIIPLVTLLIENGADVNAYDDEALMLAVKTGSFDLVQLLLDNGADIQARNGEAREIAEGYEDEDMIEYLEERGG